MEPDPGERPTEAPAAPSWPSPSWTPPSSEAPPAPSGAPPAPSEARPAPTHGPPSPPKLVVVGAVLTFSGGVLAVVGSVIGWFRVVSNLGQSTNRVVTGLSGPDGKITLTIGIILVGLAVLLLIGRTRVAQVAAAAVASLGGAVAIAKTVYDMTTARSQSISGALKSIPVVERALFRRALERAFDLGILRITIEAGIVLVLVGGVLALVGGVLALLTAWPAASPAGWRPVDSGARSATQPDAPRQPGPFPPPPVPEPYPPPGPGPLPSPPEPGPWPSPPEPSPPEPSPQPEPGPAPTPPWPPSGEPQEGEKPP